MKTYDLVALGEIAVDVILAGVDKIPRSWSVLGRTKTAGIFAAGSAGYVAECYAQLGGRAAVAGRIGRDNVGRVVVDGFHQYNVSTRYLVVDKDCETEVSTVIVYDNGNKTSILSEIPPIDPHLIDFSLIKKTRALHIGGYLLLPGMWGRNIKQLLKMTDRENVPVSLDPQMSATGEWSNAFRGVFDGLELLLLDEVEALSISRKKTASDAIEKLLKSGVRVVAVKAGNMGCIVGGNGRISRVKAVRTRTLSTIGAGDAFDAAFIYGYLRKWPLDKVAKFANVVASTSTTHLGCMTAIPRAEEALRIMNAHYC
jgi:sugar/nucleoside kinase (ribokinase family)